MQAGAAARFPRWTEGLGHQTVAKVDRNKLLANAQKLIQRGDLAKAVSQYELLMEAQPQDVQSLLRLAGLYLRVDRADDAVKAYMNVGKQYAQTGFYQKAVAAYKQALQLRPQDPQLLRQLGSLYQQMGLKGPAVECFVKAAALFAQSGDHDTAIEIMVLVLDLEPDRPDFKVRYGEYLFQAGRKIEAITVFRGLIEILKLEGQWEDLARFYERIAQMSPEDHEIGLDLARTYLRIGLAPKALQRLKVLFDAGVRDAEIFDLLARAYVLIGKNAKAVSAYLEKVRRLDARTDHDEIQKTYRRVLEIDPTNEQALLALGEGEDESEALHVLDVADEEPEQAVVDVVAVPDVAAMEPPPVEAGVKDEFSEILQEASVYIRYGIKDKAIKKLDQILAADPNNIAALRKRIEIFQSSEPKRAVPDLVRLSEIYEGLGDLEQADKAIEQAKAIDENHPALREFLGLSSAAAGTAASEDYPDADDFLGGSGISSDAAGEADELDLDLDLGFGEVEPEIAIETEVELDVKDEASADTTVVELDADEFEEAQDFADVDDSHGVEFKVDAAEGDDSESFADELEQAAFFLDTGLVSEARSLLDDLVARFGRRSEFAELLARVEQAEAGPAARAPSPTTAVSDLDDASGGGLFDLARELEEELDFADVADVSPGAEDVPSFEEIFDAFKRGVKEQLSEDDAQAHYDLGIAYMEMGIFDEAVSEFEIAKRSAQMAPDACNMIGITLTRKGDLRAAAKAYEDGLALPGLGQDIALNMHYELAVVLEELGDYRGALKHYKAVVEVDRNYRDVMQCLKRMKEKIQAKKGEEAGSNVSMM